MVLIGWRGSTHFLVPGWCCVQARARLSQEKVFLCLETVGLMAEKTKLETDCREGSAELRAMEVRTHTHTLRQLCSCLCGYLCVCVCSKRVGSWSRGRLVCWSDARL